MKTKQNKKSAQMKKILLLLLLFTSMVNAQIVNIPDANFKATLLSYSDTNNDGEVQLVEAQSITTLNLLNPNGTTITDFTGFEAFTNLQFLRVMNFASITELNLTTMNNLDTLYVDSFNSLLSIQFPSNNNLKFLSLFRCRYFLPDPINLSNLEELQVEQSLAPIMNFTALVALKRLILRENDAVTFVDASGLSNLVSLGIGYSGSLSGINLAGLVSLTNMSITNSTLNTIDVSDAISLQTMNISGATQNIFAKNGRDEIITFGLGGSPPTGVRFICVDETQLATIQSLMTNPETVVSTYCTFTPGGNYNTISGDLKFDANNNGCDTNDIVVPNVRVDINDGSIQGASFTNAIGNYNFYTQAGSFDITPSIENPTWFNFSPVTATIPFADNNNNTATQDFCISPNGIHPDVEVVISPIFFARPGFDATYQITFRNKGNQTVSGSVNLIFDDSKTDFVSANPLVDNLAVNSLSWNYSNFLPFETRTISVTLNVNSPMEIPAVNIDDILTFQGTISPLDSDENPQDNSFTFEQTVVGSYDPNDITCLEGDVVAPSEIGNYLHYAINFENTGTFPAENVVVKTEVDAAKFDIGSLQLMNTNFPVDARITGNKVEFIFENIQLPIGGHGHILLKIKTNNTLVVGDAVANRADIFFDYNFPIDTGLANTVFQALSNSVFEVDGSIAVYPNPAITEVTVKANNNIKSIQLFDAQGRVIMTSLMDDLESKLDISSYSKGIYFLKITTEKGAHIHKLIKE